MIGNLVSKISKGLQVWIFNHFQTPKKRRIAGHVLELMGIMDPESVMT